MKRMFSCSSPQVAMESWTRQDQKLLDAVARGDVARVAALASRRSARPAKLNARGQSALHVAAAGGLTECLTLLLHHGAPVNERNDDGSTALHLATIACQPQCVKVLLQHGANERHVDGQNRTPLHWAASSGCASSVVLLCDHEAPLDVPDAHGQTPLMLAAQGNHAAVCAQLLQHGAEPRLADSHGRTALALAQAHRSLEAAELLQSHMGDKDTGNVTGKALNLTLKRVPHCGGRANSAGVVGIQGREEEEEEENGHTARQLQEELERKSQECQRLEGAASGLRRQLQELVQLLPGRDEDEDEDEDRACLDLLAQHLATLRKRMRDEEQEGEHGDAKAPALIPFLAWLGEECAKMREAKASTFSQSQEWHWKAKDSPGDQGTWERLVEGLEQQLELQDQTHARMLQESQILLEKLRREATTACRCAVNGARMDLDRKSQEETPREGGRMEERMEKESMKKERMEKERMELAPGGKSCEETPRKGERMEKELLELREGNGKLLVELARLGRERERLQEELRELRELGKRDEARRLRRELEVLRDRVGARVRDSGGDASTGILRDLHCRLDALVRSQHEALQLITDMEGDSGGAPRGSGEGAIRAEPGAAESPDGPPGSEREAAESRERELREKAERLELSLQALREKAARLERACRDKDGKLKQLLVETEKLSAEVLGLRGRSTRLQLQLEVQQKQHRDTVAVYRTHLLRAAQGFMDQGVHAALLQILQDQAGAGPCH